VILENGLNIATVFSSNQTHHFPKLVLFCHCLAADAAREGRNRALRCILGRCKLRGKRSFLRGLGDVILENGLNIATVFSSNQTHHFPKLVLFCHFLAAGAARKGRNTALM